MNYTKLEESFTGEVFSCAGCLKCMCVCVYVCMCVCVYVCMCGGICACEFYASNTHSAV